MKKLFYFTLITFFYGSCQSPANWDEITNNLPDNFVLENQTEDVLTFQVDLNGKTPEYWNNQFLQHLIASGFRKATSWRDLPASEEGNEVENFEIALKEGSLPDNGIFGQFDPGNTYLFKKDIALKIDYLTAHSNQLKINRFAKRNVRFNMVKKAQEIRKKLLPGSYDCVKYYYLKEEYNADPNIAGMKKIFEDTYKIDFYEDGRFGTTLTYYGQEAGSGGDWSLSEDTRILYFYSYQGEKKVEGQQHIVKLTKDTLILRNYDNMGRLFDVMMKRIK